MNDLKILRVIGLSKLYPGASQYAIENLTFSLEPGEIVGLLGPNGAGKTTTIKCICGLINPTKGEIEIAGSKLRRRAEKISVLLEGNRNIYWRLTVWENLKFFANIQGISIRRNELDSLVNFFHLEDKIRTQARFLSLGMQQKLAVACTLVRNTPILLLDEPTLGLDVESSYELRGLLKEVTKIYNRTILLSTHDMNVVENICQRVLIINKGKLIVDESIYKLRRLFRVNTYKIILKGHLGGDQQEKIKRKFPTVAINFHSHQDEIKLDVEEPQKLYELFNILSKGRNEIENIERQDPDFEQIYLNLVQEKK